jgi:Zn finger protein HypA/HybF involved in hydrogenase expression
MTERERIIANTLNVLHGRATETIEEMTLDQCMEKPESTFCIDCGQPTTLGKGSARCPSCWEDRCGQIQDDAQHNAWERSEKE